MYKRLYILIFFNSCLLFSQQGWFWQSPFTQGNNINDIYWLNGSTAYMAGNCGTIMKSTDKGLNWSLQFTGTRQNLNVIKFINDNTGIAAGDLILRTTNSGQNWSVIDSLNYGFLALDFVNSSTGWLQKTSYSNIVLYKTTNSGLNWQEMPTNINVGSEAKCMDWISPDTGWIGANKSLYITTNGGLNWQVKITTPVNLSNLAFFNSQSGWVQGTLTSGGGTLYKTSDGGENWTAVPYTVNFYLRCMYFSDLNNGFEIGANNSYDPIIFRTTNGGLNWHPVLISNQNNSGVLAFKTISSNLNNVIASGENGIIYVSGNSGEDWDSVCYDLSNDYRKPNFVNNNTGWVISGSWYSPSSISKTTDGGFTWQKKTIDSSNTLNALYFSNENTGWAAGNNRIFKTTNGGNNWSVRFSTSDTLNFDCIYFVNNNTGWAGGYGLFKTTNGGDNWQKISSAISPESIFFINENTGWAVQYYRFLFKTTDGGYSWIQNNSIQWNHATSYKIQFINENTGFLASYSGIFRSTNGGTNWSQVYTDYSVDFTDFYIAPSGKIWAIGNYGLLISSYDMGNSWQQNYFPANWPLYFNIVFPSENTGYVFAPGSKILKTTTASIGIKPVSNNVPSSYHLYQNYPNPFNPTTNIHFDIAGNEKVRTTLIVYDVLGRQTAVILDDELLPGEYNIKWYGANLASGIYFCRMEVGYYISTIKMVLIK